MFSAIHYHPSSADIERGYRNLAAVLLHYSDDKQEHPSPNWIATHHRRSRAGSSPAGATPISIARKSDFVTTLQC